MIYFTTFILALFFTHIACALPLGCYDLTHDLYYNDQYKPPGPSLPPKPGSSLPPKPNPSLPPKPNPSLPPKPIPPPPLHATHNKKYDDPDGHTKHTACPHLAKKHPKFKDFPQYPFIGGAFDITPNSSNCGTHWKLTNKKTGESITFIAIDSAEKGFTLSEKAYKKLGGTKGGVEVTAHKLKTSSPCL